MNKSCGNCKFFELIKKNLKMGYCRRNPPVIFLVHPPVIQSKTQSMILGAREETHWPSVEESNWCGEWKPC